MRVTRMMKNSLDCDDRAHPEMRARLTIETGPRGQGAEMFAGVI